MLDYKIRKKAKETAHIGTWFILKIVFWIPNIFLPMRETHWVIDQSEFSILTEWRTLIGRLHTYMLYTIQESVLLRFHDLFSILFQLKIKNQHLDLQEKKSILKGINQ